MKSRLLAAALLLIICLLALGVAQADTLTLPRGTLRIEEEAFYGDTLLDQVDLPEEITYIGPRAFAGSSVTGSYLPVAIDEIGEDAFAGCASVMASVYRSSYAHLYCETNSVPYRLIDEQSSATPSTRHVFRGICDIEAQYSNSNGFMDESDVPAGVTEAALIMSVYRMAAAMP